MNGTLNPIEQKQTTSNEISGYSLMLWLLLPSAIIAGSATLIAWRKKNHQLIFNHKPKFLKIFVILMSTLMLLVVFMPLVASASASRGSIIWGSRSTDAWSYNSWSWRKSDGEINRASSVTSYIHNNFLTPSNGYTDYNNYGAADKGTILSEASSMASLYDYVTVIDFDHGVAGFPGQAGYNMPQDEAHYQFEDDSGNIFGTAPEYYTDPEGHTDFSHGVYDLDMYNTFAPAKVDFAFINTCMSGNLYQFGQGFTATGNPIGMPFGFTHRIVTANPTGSQMSSNGYGAPDDFPQCYIGFSYGSLALDQKVAWDDPQAPYWSVWVTFFFYFALDFDNSVNDALNLASAYSWPGVQSFTQSPLYNGFEAVWPMDKNGNGIIEDLPDYPPSGYDELVPYGGCYLSVYGNGRIHLRNFQPSDYVTAPSIGGPTTGNPGWTYDFSAQAVDSQFHGINYRFDWGDGSQYGQASGSNGQTVYASHSWAQGIYDVRVQAQCANGVWSNWSPSTRIVVGSMPTLTVHAYSNYLGYEMYGVPVYINSQYCGTTPYSIALSPGSYDVSTEPYVYWFGLQYYYYNGNSYYSSPMSVPLYSDTDITAVYS